MWILERFLCRTVPMYVQGMLNLDLYKIFLCHTVPMYVQYMLDFLFVKFGKHNKKGGKYPRIIIASLGTKQEVTKTSSSFYSLIVLRIPPPIDTLLAAIVQRK